MPSGGRPPWVATNRKPVCPPGSGSDAAAAVGSHTSGTGLPAFVPSSKGTLASLIFTGELHLAVNAHALARFAALSQETGLVPIVEPEVLMDGDHPLEHCYEVTLAAQRALFAELAGQRVALEHMLLKPNMVLAGRDSVEKPSVADAASATLRCLRNAVPPAVPGIVFLSGGQSPEEATAHLNAMNAGVPRPWVLSFSFARALQDPALAMWRGDPSKVTSAQDAFGRRAHLNGLAQLGRYDSATDTHS